VKTVGKRSIKLSVQEEELCGLQGCKMCVFEQRPLMGAGGHYGLLSSEPPRIFSCKFVQLKSIPVVNFRGKNYEIISHG
jgi:hypothetical protein